MLSVVVAMQEIGIELMKEYDISHFGWCLFFTILGGGGYSTMLRGKPG